MGNNEAIQRVKVGARCPVHFDDRTVFQREARIWIVWAVGDNQAGFGPRLDKGLFVYVAFCQKLEAKRMLHARSPKHNT